jgi:hypothetical protein
VVRRIQILSLSSDARKSCRLKTLTPSRRLDECEEPLGILQAIMTDVWIIAVRLPTLKAGALFIVRTYRHDYAPTEQAPAKLLARDQARRINGPRQTPRPSTDCIIYFLLHASALVL